LENFKRRKNTFKFTIFSIKFSNLEKLILGILPGILKFKKIIFETFFGGNILKLEKIENFQIFSSFKMLPPKKFRKLLFLISKFPAKFRKSVFPNLKI
jgi:hypothetical protein